MQLDFDIRSLIAHCQWRLVQAAPKEYSRDSTPDCTGAMRACGASVKSRHVCKRVVSSRVSPTGRGPASAAGTWQDAGRLWRDAWGDMTGCACRNRGAGLRGISARARALPSGSSAQGSAQALARQIRPLRLWVAQSLVTVMHPSALSACHEVESDHR